MTSTELQERGEKPIPARKRKQAPKRAFGTDLTANVEEDEDLPPMSLSLLRGVNQTPKRKQDQVELVDENGVKRKKVSMRTIAFEIKTDLDRPCRYLRQPKP